MPQWDDFLDHQGGPFGEYAGRKTATAIEAAVPCTHRLCGNCLLQCQIGTPGPSDVRLHLFLFLPDALLHIASRIPEF